MTSSPSELPVSPTHVLFVGMGGLGCPSARALALADLPGVTMSLLDDDVVDETNLHRQVLFAPEDVGANKADAAAVALTRLGAHATAIVDRFTPSTASTLLEGVDVVVEGADNFATKFLVADACALASVRVVHAGAVGWNGWALASDPRLEPHAPCLRCVFEDVPGGDVPTCADVGVLGPVVGVLGAVQAQLVARFVSGDAPTGELHHYRALAGRLRRARVGARAECPHARGTLRDLAPERYVAGCAT